MPRSATAPSLRTQIWSARRIVLRRWAITSVVRAFEDVMLSSASWTTRSDLASSAEVASSRTKISGSRTNARAIATRWRWPPLSFTPQSPTSVSKPSGKPLMKS